MSALPTRILWALRDAAHAGMTAGAIALHFAAHHPTTVARAVSTLRAHRLIESPDGVYRLTDAGRSAATMPNPPRWTPPRQPGHRSERIAHAP